VQRVAEQIFSALERFLHIEAVSGIALLIAAAAALLWANSPAGDSYQQFWQLPLTIGFGDTVITQPLYFFIKDGLMTVFFLVVGLEIRREIHEGALSSFKQATLPLAAAVGGVVAPALVYLLVSSSGELQRGWAVPTATDIAFAVGVLALLGRSIPGPVRVFLLALAIIDDIVAVLIIALFYSEGLQPSGFAIAAAGLALVYGFQAIGVAKAWAYVVPGAILWYGLLESAVHPSLAGVVLGLVTPVRPMLSGGSPLDVATRALKQFGQRADQAGDPHQLLEPLKVLREAQRELLPPVVRVQLALHPWVAYVIMPLFALANAGVRIDGIELEGSTQLVLVGTALGLLLGKPIGIIAGSWLAVRLGWCELPPAVRWSHVLLIGCLAGIGFTMSIFIANLAFTSEALLAAAKAGVLLASAAAGISGLLLGLLLRRRAKKAA